jgi:uncharacterized protein (DUF433 family)
MPVTFLLSYLASEMSVKEVLKEWPELELEDIYQALGYAQLETQNSKPETLTRRNNKL